MNNEWLNNLRSRMEDHEEEVPDGLWDDIRDELFSEKNENNIVAGIAPEVHHEVDKPKGDVGKTMGNRSLFYRIGGMAAAIAVLFLTLKLWTGYDDHLHSTKRVASKKEHRNESALETPEKKIDTKGEEHPGKQTPLAQSKVGAMYEHRVLLHKRDEIQQEKTSEKNDLKQESSIIGKVPERITLENRFSEQAVREQQSIDIQTKEEYKSLFEKTELKEIYARNTPKKEDKNKAKKSWMLSMLTGNVSSNSAEQQFPGYASINGKPMNIEQVWIASQYGDDPLTEILLANQSHPVEARIRHKVPVTFGLSVYYSLGKKWGIGTGLNYTKLASELHSGSTANYIKEDQTIHYVGIPVQVNYNLIRKGRFTGYVTGGALVEKPISGKITTTYVVNDEVKESSKERLDHKPLQFSVNSAVGLQLKIIDRLGVYAEPGIGYHFREENAPNTIYKEKPLHFNVKFGVRLLID
ncbi:porin family protein [Chryseobacterium pennipullorum]|uniref:Outer membrane protein beta-barrel domain-containing protein n=1 Tax=Chryseobacterium pennipullorum TaxID=2258963 RepID=A0A3D9AR48_9FLAO|nr:porin family protein [Chryseobacterium pennipullorum]REC43447.1 hypothetical protein DRF67_18955 [Chryseobacterium pennipullorum]